jgi:hypothetical protein
MSSIAQKSAETVADGDNQRLDARRWTAWAMRLTAPDRHREPEA